MTANGRGRKLKPRTDTERLDLLIKLVGFGRSRAELEVCWGEDGKGPLQLWTGPVCVGRRLLVADENGDPRALLDRAISKHAGAKKRARRRGRKP